MRMGEHHGCEGEVCEPLTLRFVSESRNMHRGLAEYKALVGEKHPIPFVKDISLLLRSCRVRN